jgi:uncharacterized protein YggE
LASGRGAAADARSKAAAMATSASVQLGDVIQISTNASAQPRAIYGASRAASCHRSEARPIPVEPRNVGFSARVSATYAIR